MSGDLILPSLEIRGFRAFRELAIERLGRVNLIVGKNNVGKTSVLEALRLYANPSPRTLLDLLSIRDQFDGATVGSASGPRPVPVPIEALFHEGPTGTNRADVLSIGPIGQPTRTVSFSRKTGSQDPGARGAAGRDSDLLAMIPYLERRISLRPPRLLPVDDLPKFARYEMTPEAEDLNISTVHNEHINSNGIDTRRSLEIWGRANLSEGFDAIAESLRIIEPRVYQVSANVDSNGGLVPIARLIGASRPVVLRSMGDGMVHLFNVGLALASCASGLKPGLFLADEIENGLHYSVHEDLWRFVFKMATDLKVQVFATTHSWDCIEAFQRAACADTSSEGYLIRLGRKRDDVVATVYDETDLAVVTRDHIEVR